LHRGIKEHLEIHWYYWQKCY